MKTKLSLFVAAIAVTLFGMGCSSVDKGSYHFIGGDGKTYGPYPLEKLIEFKNQKRLVGETKVQKDGGEFLPANRFPEIVGKVVTQTDQQTGSVAAFFPFNGNAEDISGHRNQTEVIGASLTTDRFGQEKSAYSFDGKKDFIDVKSVIISKNFYDKPSSHAISVWVSIDGTASDGEMVILSDEYGTACDHKYRIMIKKTGEEFLASYDLYNTGRVGAGDPYRRGRIGLQATSRPIVNGQWFHLIAVYDLEKGEMRFSVDGIEEKKLPIYHSNGLPVWTRLPNPTSIGALRGCTSFTPAPGLRNYFKGKIDDLRFYNRALSAKEVKALYDLEKPKTK